MSTERATRRERSRRRRSRAFLGAFALIVGALAVVGLAGAAVTVSQGPRVTNVSVDPDAAVSASGSRLIITTTQSLAKVAPAQVTVSPAAPFTVDTSGRSVGIRFTQPLWDDTSYTVTIAGLVGLGGGPAASVEQSFTTPPLHPYVLQRGTGGDTILRTDLAGADPEPVYTNPHIEDFRATSGHLVMSTIDGDDKSHLIVTDLDGGNARELPLPGDGSVTDLQSADRGDLVGYTFTDASVGTPGAREARLFTASLTAAQAGVQPTMIERAGGESRVDDWRFVPGTDSILMLTYDGALTLISPSGGDPVTLGNAVSIDGIARGTTTAIVERIDGPAAIDLASAKQVALPPTDKALGQTNKMTPLADGSTLRVLAVVDGFTVRSTTVNVVDASGTATPVFSVQPKDILIQSCVSPSGRYGAFLVAPDAVSNPYDGYKLPLPTHVRTHVVTLTGPNAGTEVGALAGFDISWCQTPPRG
ncbi:hypothetical protein ITJ43_09675 [Microbacterium sp. VKM Ac-2870]|uniref:Ig-like domain-containing protein n=1 Tax=Microbacterium sp. VKM Ac-2870 TaxID=2783825 RepID=UPI00188B5C0E|nr:Ig-like domain-containing protein [Microbacterium sp. VKM Ac-2870]MBF4562410.1 hypothetical protein [Microbacterium sp. VKM Ac-2870]